MIQKYWVSRTKKFISENNHLEFFARNSVAALFYTLHLASGTLLHNLCRKQLLPLRTTIGYDTSHQCDGRLKLRYEQYFHENE